MKLVKKAYKNLDLEMLFACIVARPLHPIQMLNITLKQGISQPRGIPVNFATSIVKLSMA